MFNLNMMHSCVYNGAYGLANIGISNFDVALCYIVAIVVSIIVALILRVPLLPSKPYMYSFDVSALYPTPIMAMGILSLFFVLSHILHSSPRSCAERLHSSGKPSQYCAYAVGDR